MVPSANHVMSLSSSSQAVPELNIAFLHIPLPAVISA